ncbi:MAG: peptidoglycan DD-metalloendopeptidase family protein [Bacteroidales bacterium]
MKRFWLLTYAALMLTGGLQGQDRSNLESQKKKAFEEIKVAKELLEETEKEKAASMHQVQIIQRGIRSRRDLVSALEQEVRYIEQDMLEVQKQVETLEKEMEIHRDEYARLIYYAYTNQTNYEKLMYLLASESISQSYQRFKYLKYLSEYRVQKTEEIDSLVKKLEDQKVALEKLMGTKLNLITEKEREESNLVQEREKGNGLVLELQKKERQLQNRIKEKERIARELETQIRKIIEEEARKAAEESRMAVRTPEREVLGEGFQSNQGKLPWPVERGLITSGFGLQEIQGLRGSSVKNNGIDISSSAGSDVRAVYEGQVTKVFAILGANNTVLIRHGEYLSVYQNLVQVRVKSGDRVSTKQIIGQAFSEENSGVSLIHFEVWKEKEILNPELWLSK